ncbi:hypothetical protein F962_02442 [Acinetobacter baumannii NIPH 190]|nr:hypothetical protein F962_02442 [Acinetobacter baumannii NIPH 190]
MSEQQQELTRSMNVSYSEPPLPRASLVIWIVGIGLVIFFIWAWFFKLEEVSTGTGKVIPSSIVKLLYYSYKIRKKLEITHRLSRSTILYAYV